MNMPYRTRITAVDGVIAVATVVKARNDQNSNSILGLWENPNSSVRVGTGESGDWSCGAIILANEKAAKAVQGAGTTELVGVKRQRDCRPTAPNHWQGHVFVSELGNSYYSTITKLNGDQIEINGCLLGGLIYKSQIWRRV
jgi:uncharacterized protein (DUF2147 family)